MTVVVKLGSSIVADSEGVVRGDVLDAVCGQVAELHHGGEDVDGDFGRDRARHEADRAAAEAELDRGDAGGVGGRPGHAVQGVRESRLAEREVHAAQVPLTSFDLAVRMHYLNARQALRKLLDWRASRS